MVRIIMFRLWPAFIPLIVYVLWMLYRRRKAKRDDSIPPAFRDGPWVWAVGASLLIAMLCFISLGLSTPHNSGTSYQPTQLKDGKLIKGGFE